MEPFGWHMPTRVVMEPGAVARLAEQDLGKRPLLVTGRNSARTCGALDRLLAQFPDAAVFDAVEENPSTETCDAGGALCRDAACDFVVGVGGGSPMDAAKVIAMLARNPGRTADYFGRDVFTGGNLPIVAVPTTAGTGSEVTPYAVITHRAEKAKKTVAGATLFPQVALLDAELSVSMPRHVTVNTGLDALSQAMEGMVAVRATPLGDALAPEACRIVLRALPRAADVPGDLEARARMLYAAMLSGCIIAQSGTTLVHGMGYPLTLEFGLAHGLANALLLIPLFRHNARHVPEKVAALATALGHPAEPTPDDAAAKITSAIADLARALGVSLAGRDAGVERERLRELAERTYAERARFANQPGDLTLDEVHALYLDAWEGPRG